MIPQNFGKVTWNLDCWIARSPAMRGLEFLDGLQRLIAFLGMDTAGMSPDIRRFPLPDGRGGKGQTIFQPFVEPRIIHQPLTTSFVTLDIWPEHFTLTLKSCLQFSPAAVVMEVERLFGPVRYKHDWTLGPALAGVK